MITNIREIRKGFGLTLADVAARCTPPTTPQTIGRLETGTRTLSVDWLNRIAAALDVDAAALVSHPDQPDIAVAAELGAAGAEPLRVRRALLPPRPTGDMVAVQVTASLGDYRQGDAIWCRRIAAGNFASARNCDALVPRAAGRFAFGRVLDVDSGRVQLLPLASGARQIVIDAPWLAIATTLIRSL